MQPILPHTLRRRVTNYGDAQRVSGSQRATLFELTKEQAAPLALYVVCEQFSIPPADVNAADFRPYVHVEWGHGASSMASDYDVTFRQRIALVASTVQVQAFIASLPRATPDGGFREAPVPAGATARFRAFIGEGLDGIKLFPTRWVTQLGAATGVLAEGQARLCTLRVFVAPAAGGAASAPLYLLLFDQIGAPAGGETPVDGFPLVAPSPGVAAAGPRALPLGQTRAFVFGAAWAVSSTPFVHTPASGAQAFVSAELQQ